MKLSCAILAISLFCLAGCGARDIAVHSLFHGCNRPALSAMPVLNDGEHLGSPGNVAALMEIIDLQALDMAAFSSALTCYEAQAAPGRDSR